MATAPRADDEPAAKPPPKKAPRKAAASSKSKKGAAAAGGGTHAVPTTVLTTLAFATERANAHRREVPLSLEGKSSTVTERIPEAKSKKTACGACEKLGADRLIPWAIGSMPIHAVPCLEALYNPA